MSARDAREILHDILRHACKARADVVGVTYEQFVADWDLRLKIERLVGEAVNRLPDELKTKYPETGWRTVTTCSITRLSGAQSPNSLRRSLRKSPRYWSVNSAKPWIRLDSFSLPLASAQQPARSFGDELMKRTDLLERPRMTRMGANDGFFKEGRFVTVLGGWGPAPSAARPPAPARGKGYNSEARH
jgi:hypothetical protein